jgi:ABC-2 type transport system ATP-binding protein
VTNLTNHEPTTRAVPREVQVTEAVTGLRDSYALVLDHVTKRYGATAVVDDLTFTVQPGRVTGFLGPNGAGKSTTMKILLDLASADGGSATIGGHRYRDLPDPATTVGVVLEPNAFHPGRSGRDHLRVLATATGIPKERVDEMLAFVDLSPEAADRRVGAYSLGMKQRLSLAGALLGNPPVLVLDEPGNGLDPQGIRALRDLLRARTAAGGTVFVSSHLLSEVEHLADDVVVIDRGKLVTTGSLRELQQSTVLVRTASAETLRDVLIAAGGLATIQAPDTILVRALPIDEIGEQAFRAGVALHELSPHAGSLEELFLSWTGAASSKEVIGL